MFSCIDVAKLFLSWANKDGELISNLKMQKLLYYAQAWHLVFFNKSLFDEPIEAWDFGPVIPQAYHALKKFKCRAISYKEIGNEEDAFKKNQLEFLVAVYSKFVKISAHELVNMTHNERPWKEAFAVRSTVVKVISNESMRKFYSQMLERKKSS